MSTRLRPLLAASLLLLLSGCGNDDAAQRLEDAADECGLSDVYANDTLETHRLWGDTGCVFDALDTPDSIASQYYEFDEGDEDADGLSYRWDADELIVTVTP